ncbi:glycosyltransferase family 4 protein [Nocardioides sambongensis]|uniref:glycosyltransferase family 4 protein n=1 Tax=Nocardioides sambongensis TaxID=2589074 RepID=UPI002F25ED04
MGRLFGSLATLFARAIVRRSVGVVYVSQEWLQARYPAPIGVPVLARSNVVLGDEAYVDAPRSLDLSRPIRLCSIGAMNGKIKGHDVLIEATQILNGLGLKTTLSLIGDGPRMAELANISAHRGIRGDVNFLGQVHAPERVREILDESDIYLSGSYSEGLSRAMVEAMARALPVVSTDAGAVGELIENQYIVAPGDATAISGKVAALVENSVLYESASRANLACAKNVGALASPGRLANFLRSVTEGSSGKCGR